MRTSHTSIILCTAAIAVFCVSAGIARDHTAFKPADTLTRQKNDSLQKQVNEEKSAQTETFESLDFLNKRIDEVQTQVRQNRAGENRVLIAGDASFAYTISKGFPSSMSAGVAPLVLWRLGSGLLFEGAFDIGVSNDQSGSGVTGFDLTLANLTYLLNDYVTLGAGLFVVPLGVHHNHFDPPWISPLTDDPLPFSDNGIAPGSGIGLFASGAVPFGRAAFNYFVYITNGPRLITDDSTAAGTLNFDNFDDNNDGKTFGGRLGARPLPELEIGYSLQYGLVAPPGFGHVGALLQGADMEYRRDVTVLRGQADFRSELVFSNVDRATYGPSASTPFAPLTFNNNRGGGYVQAAYRPWMVNDAIVRNLQMSFRYDWLYAPLEAPGGDRENRWSIGLNYWLRPTIVIKSSYEFDQATVNPNSYAMVFLVGIGL